jgi:hypothetical protein
VTPLGQAELRTKGRQFPMGKITGFLEIERHDRT